MCSLNALKASAKCESDIKEHESFRTCLMDVTVMTKKRGRPLVIGLVGVSMISYIEMEGGEKSHIRLTLKGQLTVRKVT